MNEKHGFWGAWAPTLATGIIVFALLAVALFGALPHVLGQGVPQPVSAVTPRTITVVGEGTVKAKPDTAVASIGVETSGPTVKVATAENSDTMNAVMAALKAQGIADKDIQTSGFNVWIDRGPNLESGAQPMPTYRVNNNVTVTIRDLTKVGAVLDAVIGAGANSIYGVNFGLDDPKPLLVQARDKAASDALAKANELAKLNGLQVVQVLSVSEVLGNGGYYPMSARAYEVNAGKGGAGSAGPISAGELEITAQLQVIYTVQ